MFNPFGNDFEKSPRNLSISRLHPNNTETSHTVTIFSSQQGVVAGEPTSSKYCGFANRITATAVRTQ
jgi:hypothetical protein